VKVDRRAIDLDAKTVVGRRRVELAGESDLSLSESEVDEGASRKPPNKKRATPPGCERLATE